jgi:hypothetical protein
MEPALHLNINTCCTRCSNVCLSSSCEI